MAAEAHPVADCPDREAARPQRRCRPSGSARELDDLERQVQGRTGSLARRFDRVLRLLEAWGYLDGWSLTDVAASVLARTYHESRPAGRRGDDHAGCSTTSTSRRWPRWCRASPTSTAGRDRPPEPRFPSSTVRTRFVELRRLADDLAADEETAGLPATRPPDAGFVAPRPRVGGGRRPGRRCSRTRSSPAATSSAT